MTGARLPPLLEAVLAIGTDLDLRTILQHVVDSAAELTGARQAALCTVDPGRDGLTEILPRTTPSPPASGPPAPGPPSTPCTSRTPGGTPHSPDTLRVPIHVQDERFGDLHLAGKPHDAPFTAEDEQLLHVLAAQAGIAIGNARLYEAARQRERWIEGAAAVTTALLTRESAADALMTVAERARILADAVAGVILQPTDAGGMEIVTASTYEDPGDIVGTTIQPGSPVLVQLLGGEPVFIDDSATDPRMTTHVRHRFGPSMMLPLEADGRLIGTLALPRRRGDRPYTPVERLLAVQFASQAALALVLADAQAGRERLAVYEDRDRIARDLHDLVVQRLFATGMMLESTQRRSTGEDGIQDMLTQAVDELRSTVQEVRTAIFALQQPPAAPPAGLRGKVLRESAGAATVLGFKPSTQFTGAVDSRVTDPVADRLLAELRRALAAASRRPGISRIEIGVDATAVLPDGRDAVRLTVHDDGAGDEGSTDNGAVDEGSTDNGSTGTTVTWQEPL